MENNEISAADSLKPASGLGFKKSLKSKNARKRPVIEEEDEAIDGNAGNAVVHKTKAPKTGKMSFTTASAAKKAAKPNAGDDSTPWKSNFSYESTRLVQTENDSGATARLETETEFDRDARAIREKVLKNADDAIKGVKPGGEKTYKGMAGYTDHTAGFRREQTVGSEKASGAHGPLRASSHIRWSVRFDYQPDICKDYKETGYCGYGDACIFLHDRGDYKSGWQLESEWDEKEKKRKERLAMGLDEEEEGAVGSGEEDEEERLPFACFICRDDFTDPVMTRCKHYFCEHCALKHHAKSKNCFVCNKPTNGVFNVAHEIVKRMKEDAKKKELEGEEGGDGKGAGEDSAEEEQEAEDDGEEGGEEDGE